MVGCPQLRLLRGITSKLGGSHSRKELPLTAELEDAPSTRDGTTSPLLILTLDDKGGFELMASDSFADTLPDYARLTLTVRILLRRSLQNGHVLILSSGGNGLLQVEDMLSSESLFQALEEVSGLPGKAKK